VRLNAEQTTEATSLPKQSSSFDDDLAPSRHDRQGRLPTCSKGRDQNVASLRGVGPALNWAISSLRDNQKTLDHLHNKLRECGPVMRDALASDA